MTTIRNNSVDAGGASGLEWESAPAAPATPTPAAPPPYAAPQHNRLHRAAAYVGRKLRPSQVVLDGGAAMVSYRLEPAGRVDSQGYHPPGSNYSTLENQRIDYDQLAYAPVTYALAPGEVNKAKAHLNTAYHYGTDKLFNREGRPARRPVPVWLRKLGESAGDALTNVRKGRLSKPKPQLTQSRTDAMLVSRGGLEARARQLFHVDDADPAGAAGIERLLTALESLGTACYPVPVYQKQALLIEALAAATGGNLAEAGAAEVRLRRGLDPAAAGWPVRDAAAARDAESVAWRVAQLLAAAGGDGFDTLILAGAVPRSDGAVPSPARGYSPAARKQQALRVYLEARAQAAEVRGGGARSDGDALRAALLRDSAAQAAIKLWNNPRAGDGGGPPVAAAQRLSRAEKNAYYEWTQQFGRPGTQGMLGKTRERLHKLVTTYMERAQERGGEGEVSTDAWNFQRVAGRYKSPLTALQFGTRGAHRRTPDEIRKQYDTLLRTLLRELERHLELQVPASADFDSLARNLLDRELLRQWCAQAIDRRADGAYARRPLEGAVDRAAALAAVRAILGPPAGADPLTPALRALVPNPATATAAAAIAALAPDPVWRGGLLDNDAGFSLALLERLIGRAGIDANVIGDGLLGEFGLNAANRNNLPTGMAKYRLFGNDGAAPATVRRFLGRARNIRDRDDALTPRLRRGGDVIDALKQFNDTYIREEPMGPRVRAQDGGVLGFNNVGLALNMLHLYVAPNPSFALDQRAFFEYNSGGHAFEVAFGVQKTVNAGLGVSVGHGVVAPDGTLVSATATAGLGLDGTSQEAVRLRGRRELNERGEALLVADDPGGPHHGRTLAPALGAGGAALLVDPHLRLATSAAGADGATVYTYADNGETLVGQAGGGYTDALGQPRHAGQPWRFSPAYAYADDAAPANDVARMDKARFHLMQATDFIFEEAARARDAGHGTPTQLWDRWVDRFFDNPDVSVSYQHHRHVGQSITGNVGVSARDLLDSGARPGGGVGLGYTERAYEALNRTDQTGSINRTLVQIGYSGQATATASASVGTPGLGPDVGGLSPRAAGVSATFADQGVLAAFRTVESDGKIIPEFTYMDIEYRNIDLYQEYLGKNRAVWEAFYGHENLEKHLDKLLRDDQPNQRYSERWRLSPEGVHQLRSYLALSKIQHGAARRDASADRAELQEIEAREIARFAAGMLEDRALWDPLGAYVVEVNSKERAVGVNFLLQAQQVTRSVADAELDWIGGSSASMNAAARLRATRAEERQRAQRIQADIDRGARAGGDFLPPIRF